MSAIFGQFPANFIFPGALEEEEEEVWWSGCMNTGGGGQRDKHPDISTLPIID